MNSKEYQEGYEAWMRYQLTYSDNPYSPNTDQYNDWKEGHYMAVLEDGEAYESYYAAEDD